MLSYDKKDPLDIEMEKALKNKILKSKAYASILEIAYNVGKVLRLKPKFIFEPNRAGDVRHTLADITLAKKYLGYKPLINFEDGMEKVKSGITTIEEVLRKTKTDVT